MGNNTLSPDTLLKDYWRNNDRFADLFNQVFFQGNPILNSNQLKELDADASTFIKTKKDWASISRRRDLIKQYQSSTNLVLLGIENQQKVHYGMPVRTMLYDALGYTRQCKQLAQDNRKHKKQKTADEFLSGLTLTDKLQATVTLVIYYGERPWDGPTSLEDMVEISPDFLPFFNNHKLHLLQATDIKGCQFANSDNQDFFTFIQEFYEKGHLDLEELKKKQPDSEVYWETLAAIGAATGTTELATYAIEHEGGIINMCTALENLKQEGRIAGLQEGHIAGLQEGISSTVTILKSLGLDENEISKKIQDGFHLNASDTKKYI